MCAREGNEWRRLVMATRGQYNRYMNAACFRNAELETNNKGLKTKMGVCRDIRLPDLLICSDQRPLLASKRHRCKRTKYAAHLAYASIGLSSLAGTFFLSLRTIALNIIRYINLLWSSASGTVRALILLDSWFLTSETQRRYSSTEAGRQQEVLGKMSNPLLSSLSTFSRRPAGMLHPRSRHSYQAIQGRAASSASKRNTSKQKPIYKPSVSSLRASNTAGSSLGPGKQSRAGDPRSKQQPTTTPIDRPTLQRPRTSGMQGSIENSPEYKSASRKWVASIIALPIFIVTSYFLFDRCRLPPRLAGSHCSVAR